LVRDFIKIDPESDLEFLADVYCSSVLTRVLENSFFKPTDRLTNIIAKTVPNA
jgi:hypothetical protein